MPPLPIDLLSGRPSGSWKIWHYDSSILTIISKLPASSVDAGLIGNSLSKRSLIYIREKFLAVSINADIGGQP